MHPARTLVALLAAVMLGVAPGSCLAQTLPCAASVALVRTVLAEQGLDAAIRIYSARVMSDCLGREQAAVARALAQRHLPAVAAAEAGGAPPSAQLQIVRRGLALDGTAWQLRELEGDLIQAAAASPGTSEFAAASASYLAAMQHMTAPQDGQSPPRTDEVARVASKIEQTSLLSERVSPEAIGRILTVVRVAQPIYYKEGRAEFTELGHLAVAELLAMLRSRGMPAVRLLGHTDARGSPAANDRLSLARAQAVVTYLEQNGYPPGRATAEGRGSRDPYQPVPIAGVTFTQAQRWQMDRRVDVVLTP